MIENFFKLEKQAIDERLIKFFNKLERDEKDVIFNDFIEEFKKFVIPENKKAKRINPILLIAAFTGIINPMYLDEQLEEIRKVSIAVEFLHSGHLIHDDLIDDDKTRRGNPTFHVQLQNEIEQVYKSLNIANTKNLINLYGRDMSILAGSLGYLMGLDVIKSSKFPDNLKLMAVTEYSEALNYLMRGHILEEYLEYNNITMTLEQYLNIAEMLRARLFEKSVKIGAILARGNVHYQIKPLSEAMLRIGQAYAIRDDILDSTEDIKSKKRKFLYILSVQNTNEEQSKRLNEIYHKKALTKNDIKEVENIFAETNALVIAEHFSKNLIEQAKNYLKDIYPDLNKKQKMFFIEFCDYNYMRKF